MTRKLLVTVLFLAFAFVTSHADSAQEKWALVETQVNPTNEPLEFYGGGTTPYWFTEPRFEGKLLVYTVSSTSFSVHDVNMDHGFVYCDVNLTTNFAAPPSELIPGQTVSLTGNFSHSGVVDGYYPGIRFWYSGDGVSMNPSTAFPYYPWSQGFTGDSTVTYSFTVPNTHSGEIKIHASWWNAPGVWVVWRYEAAAASIEPELELTYPAGQSPKVFVKGWVFGAKCTYTNATGQEVDISDQVSWGGTAAFNPSKGSRSYPWFNSFGQNTIELSVTIDGVEYKKEYQVEAINTADYAHLSSGTFTPADAHGCPGCAHSVVGLIQVGSPNVSIRGYPAARVGDSGIHAACCGPNLIWSIMTGDENVLIDGKPAARIGDVTEECGGMGRITTGSPGNEPNRTCVTPRLKDKPRTCETPPQIDAQTNGTGSISGTVTNTSNAGILGVGVTAYGETNIGCWGDITDANGDYQITGLPDDTFRIYFWGENWHFNEGYGSSWYNAKSSMDAADTVTITGSASVTGIDATLTQGGSISGTVKDASGNGIVKATVMAVDESGETTGSVTFGDIIQPGTRAQVVGGDYEYGTYKITGLEDGDYQVYCSAGPLGYSSEWYNDRSSQGSADSVTITTSSQVTGIDFVLSGSGGIAGTVTDTGGTGIEDVYVKAFGLSTNASGIGVTDENGAYEIPGLVDDSYRLEFDGQSQGYVSQWYNDKANWDTAGTVAVIAPTKTTGIDAELSSAAGSTSIPLNVVGFTTDLTGPPASANTVGITFTAQASSGTLSYRFYRATGFQTQSYGNWLQVKNWGTDNNLSWMAGADDHYIIVAHVTTDTTSSNFHQAGLSLETSGNSANPIQITSFTTNITYPQSSGTAITLNTAATGGSGQLYYRYYYRKLPDGQWTVIRVYDTNSTGTWTPSEDGWYVVVVHVTDNVAGNTFSTAGMTCTIGQ